MGEQSEQSAEAGKQTGHEKPKPVWMNYVDAELAFRLIDSILPFEACLYHQILPLSLEGSRLKVGMVNPDDTAALDYVRRILAYMNCSLIPHPLASDIHYAALSAYLSSADRHKQPHHHAPQPVARRIAKKLAEQSAKQFSKPGNEGGSGHAKDPHSHPTLMVDSPSTLPAVPIEEEMGANPHDITVAELAPETPTKQIKDLSIHPQYLSEPIENLTRLPAPQLLEELLGRVLSWGIGRLYLEAKAEQGRILWSQNGILKAVLEDLPLSALSQVIQELKQLTQLPLTPMQHPKQVEIDRVYQGHQLLLRLRIIPGKYGSEEATLQVLRGAALQFYRQQQLVAMGQEVLGVAQQLQQKMNEVYTYSQSHRVELPSRLNILPEIDRALKRVGYQLQELQTLKYQNPEEKP